jgi:hypothetical protein
MRFEASRYAHSTILSALLSSQIFTSYIPTFEKLQLTNTDIILQTDVILFGVVCIKMTFNEGAGEENAGTESVLSFQTYLFLETWYPALGLISLRWRNLTEGDDLSREHHDECMNSYAEGRVQ